MRKKKWTTPIVFTLRNNLHSAVNSERSDRDRRGRRGSVSAVGRRVTDPARLPSFISQSGSHHRALAPLEIACLGSRAPRFRASAGAFFVFAAGGLGGFEVRLAPSTRWRAAPWCGQRTHRQRVWASTPWRSRGVDPSRRDLCSDSGARERPRLLGGAGQTPPVIAADRSDARAFSRGVRVRWVSERHQTAEGAPGAATGREARRGATTPGVWPDAGRCVPG